MKTKIICVSLIFIILMTIISNLKISKAENISEINLYSKEKLQCLIYNGMLVRNEFVVYNQDGIEYPAYCLNRELDGVSVEKGGYAVKTENLIDNNLVWNAIINGYPYKTYQELNCNSDIEAFAATKMAVYDMLYNYDWNDFKPANEQGERVLNAAMSISNIAKNYTREKNKPKINIENESEEWTYESEYISKTYIVTSTCEFDNYLVNLNNNMIIANENNILQNVFKKGEKFKILIPIQELSNNGEFEIEVNANVETYPIYYGKSTLENFQNYAITGSSYENANTRIIENYDKNETKLVITKQDEETKERIPNCHFQVSFESAENIIYDNLITNENGEIIIESIMPGEYFIKELEPAIGYQENNELIQIFITFNEEKVVLVNNKKEIKEEIIVQPEEVIEVVENKLPKTGF